jgi:hypothetical protein
MDFLQRSSFVGPPPPPPPPPAPWHSFRLFLMPQVLVLLFTTATVDSCWNVSSGGLVWCFATLMGVYNYCCRVPHAL